MKEFIKNVFSNRHYFVTLIVETFASTKTCEQDIFGKSLRKIE